jgi:hypothetical protein
VQLASRASIAYAREPAALAVINRAHVDLAFGIPSLTVLVLAFAYVRHVARRGRKRREARARTPSRGMRSLSQRSEMRAGDDPTSVMEDLSTHSRPAQRDLPVGERRKAAKGSAKASAKRR